MLIFAVELRVGLISLRDEREAEERRSGGAE